MTNTRTYYTGSNRWVEMKIGMAAGKLPGFDQSRRGEGGPMRGRVRGVRRGGAATRQGGPEVEVAAASDRRIGGEGGRREGSHSESAR